MRAPSHAPAARYPCGRSRTLALFLCALAGCGLACILAWLMLGTGNADVAAKASVGLGTWLFCSAVAWRGWLCLPAGHLSWDGGQWLLEDGMPGSQQGVPGWPKVHVDLQAAMLLSLQPAQGRVVWLWLERRSDPQQWLMLRRAIYSPARLQTAGVTETMSATPARRDDRAPL